MNAMSSRNFMIVVGITLVLFFLISLWGMAEESPITQPSNGLRNDQIEQLKLQNDVLQLKIQQHRILIRQIAWNIIESETDAITILDAMESIK